jgi:hypothetical protein
MHPLIKYLTSFRLLYIVGGGFFFYLLSVFIDPVFIPVLQMPENGCQKWIETRSGYQKQMECVEFGNPLDELKYKHNREMEKWYQFIFLWMSPYSHFFNKAVL